MTTKYRVYEVAKDFGQKSSDIIKLLEQYFEEPKKHQTALEPEELDVIFDTLTQKYAVESFDEYFASAQKKRLKLRKRQTKRGSEKKEAAAETEKKSEGKALSPEGREGS